MNGDPHEPDASPFADYRALLAKVDAHGERVVARNPAQFRCRSGCTACCRQDITVARIEADHIADWIGRHELPPHDPATTDHDQHALFSQLAGATACAFLGPGGGCAIYPVRPVICRTHGLPILSEADRVDLCPLNGRVGEGDEPFRFEREDILATDRLNVILATVDRLHVASTGASPDRTSLTQLRTRAEPSV